jgi:hypothetical protein
MNGPWNPSQKALPGEANRGGQRERAKVTPKVFICFGMLNRSRGHSLLPAQDGRLVRPVQNGPGDSLRLPADSIYDKVTLILSHRHHIIHIYLHLFLKLGNLTPRNVPLQLEQKELKPNNLQQHGNGVSLPDKKCN